MDEHFTTTLRGWIASSDGYSIRIGGRSGIEFRDGHGQIHISAERMSDPPTEVVVYTGSIPDTEDRPKSDVVGKLGRAFASAGLVLTLDDASG